jgi:hypothetical protein
VGHGVACPPQSYETEDKDNCGNCDGEAAKKTHLSSLTVECGFAAFENGGDVGLWRGKS